MANGRSARSPSAQDHPREQSSGFSISYIFYRHRRSILVYFSIIALVYTGALLYRRQNETIFGDRKRYYLSTDHERTLDGNWTQHPEWTFDSIRDRANHRLTRAQCSAAFPDLFVELDRALDLWKARLGEKKLTREKNMDFSWAEGGLQGMVHDQNLYITASTGLNHFKHWEERSKLSLNAINRALLTSPEPIPDFEFLLKIDDTFELPPENEHLTAWAFQRDTRNENMKRVWLVPEFGFYSYQRVAGGYDQWHRHAVDNFDDFDKKRDKLVWRGTTAFNAHIRNALIKQSNNKTWSDVREVDEQLLDPCHKDAAKLGRISMHDHCRWKFGAHTEGTTWSARITYLLGCNSVVVSHALRYTTHLYHLLKSSGPEQNFVMVRDDFSDLDEQMTQLLDNPEKAKRIARNAADKFRDRYTTPAAQTCYWRELFHRWASISAQFDPYEDDVLADGTVERKIRGMTHEEYTMWQKDYPFKDGQRKGDGVAAGETC